MICYKGLKRANEWLSNNKGEGDCESERKSAAREDRGDNGRLEILAVGVLLFH